MRLWNPLKTSGPSDDGGLLIKSYSGAHGYGVLDVCVSPDNSRFVSAGGDRTAFLWDVGSGRVLRRFSGHSQRINAVALSEEGSVLLTGSYDKTVCLWDLRAAARDPLQVLADFRDSVSAVVCSSPLVVTGCVDGCLRTYDLRAGLMHRDDLLAPVTHVSLTPDRRCALSACLGGAVRLLDLSSGRGLLTFRGHRQDTYRTEARVCADDSHVVAGSEDGRLVVWGFTTGRVSCSAEAHAKPVASVDSHPSRMELLSAGADGSILLWTLDRQDQS